MQTQIEISYNLEYIERVKFEKLNDSIEEMQRMLRALGKSVKAAKY